MKRTFFLLLSALSLVGCVAEQNVGDVGNGVATKNGGATSTDAAEKPEERASKITGDRNIEVPDRVFFPFDSSFIDSKSKQSLAAVAEWLKTKGNVTITIEGHCDQRGSREYNLSLGQKRAKAAKDYLTSKGVAAGRIRTVSYGKERPAFKGEGEEVWSKNRRAVVVTDNIKADSKKKK
ncbi:MAG: peptidoglycan-associated lipoprotein Pal [Rickettsiales bacterium]|jgi:peptidoglycan-associated lipoprotein|nr:peptidoglycan-associated lipoprotein Pal [Rickettsiales bacterium]